MTIRAGDGKINLIKVYLDSINCQLERRCPVKCLMQLLCGNTLLAELVNCSGLCASNAPATREMPRQAISETI